MFRNDHFLITENCEHIIFNTRFLLNKLTKRIQLLLRSYPLFMNILKNIECNNVFNEKGQIKKLFYVLS